VPVVRISLLHATYRNPHAALRVRSAWLDTAADPSTTEHIFGIDLEDAATIAATEGLRRVVATEAAHGVTAVRNWNAAAAVATGDLLFVIADDLVPPAGWDEAVLKFAGSLDPLTARFAVKVADKNDPTDVLLRHPVVSRAFYAAFGLFSPDYRGMYADNDLTLRAFRRAAILDGRSLVLVHDHPFENPSVEATASQLRINDADEYEHGAFVLRAQWSRFRRRGRVYLVEPSPRLTTGRLEGVARAKRLLSDIEQMRFAGRAIARRARNRHSARSAAVDVRDEE
jgi:hypothetical protein